MKTACAAWREPARIPVMRIRLMVSLLVVVSVVGVMHSQNRGPFDVDVVSIPLMVSVVDNKGALIPNLKKEDFKVYEDGKLQTIRSFSKDTDLPLSIALLVDSSTSVIDKLKFEKEAAAEFFFNTIKPRKDRASVISFDDKPRVLSNRNPDGFLDEPSDLAEALKDLRAGGVTAVYDAVYRAAEVLLSREKGERRKLIILISDGEDTASKFSRAEALEMAQRHDVTIYAVSTNKTSDTQSKGKLDGDEMIRALVDETGGKAYFPLRLDDLSADFQKIGDELRSQYVLSYTPTKTSLDGTFRKVRVEMVNDKFKARTRSGYFASKK
jgi:Ca-activated chloride channel family protein